MTTDEEDEEKQDEKESEDEDDSKDGGQHGELSGEADELDEHKKDSATALNQEANKKKQKLLNKYQNSPGTACINFNYSVMRSDVLETAGNAHNSFRWMCYFTFPGGRGVRQSTPRGISPSVQMLFGLVTGKECVTSPENVCTRRRLSLSLFTNQALQT